MTLEKFKSLRPRDFEEYLGYIFMEAAPEDVHGKDSWEEDFGSWLQYQDLETIIEHADAYAGLQVSYNVQK